MMAAAILWFIGCVTSCVKVVGVVANIRLVYAPWSYPFAALVYEILVDIVFVKN